MFTLIVSIVRGIYRAVPGAVLILTCLGTAVAQESFNDVTARFSESRSGYVLNRSTEHFRRDTDPNCCRYSGDPGGTAAAGDFNYTAVRNAREQIWRHGRRETLHQRAVGEWHRATRNTDNAEGIFYKCIAGRFQL